MLHRLSKKLYISDERVFEIINIIRANNGTARLVGGVVRDYLLKRPCNDIDISTDLLPDKISAIFSDAGYKVILSGIKFGTVTVIAGGKPYEITTLRRDVETDGRHAKVDYTKDYEEDAARRDFTINALSYDPSEEKIYDYFHGIDDLKNFRVRFIGQPDDRIQEDYLRILRFFRFSAYYADSLDIEGIDACSRHAHNIQKLSKERIKSEIDKLILSRRAPTIFAALIEGNIWQYVFGLKDFNPSILDKAFILSDTLGEKPLDYTLYALITVDQRLSIEHLIELKFSRNQAKIIKDIHKLADYIQAGCDIEIKAILTEHWLQAGNWKQYFLAALTLSLTLSNKKLANIIQILYNELCLINNRPVFPVKGTDLIDYDIKDKQLGVTLKRLKVIWIENKFSLSKSQLVAIALNIVKEK